MSKFSLNIRIIESVVGIVNKFKITKLELPKTRYMTIPRFNFRCRSMAPITPFTVLGEPIELEFKGEMIKFDDEFNKVGWSNEEIEQFENPVKKNMVDSIGKVEKEECQDLLQANYPF